MSGYTHQDIALGKRFRRQNQRRKFFRFLGGAASAVVVAGVLYFAWLSRQEDSPNTDALPDDFTSTQFDIPTEARAATVDYVHDGDTLFIELDGERLKARLIGIDTPEVGDNLECYGDEATAIARSLMPEGSAVWALSDGGKLDQYGRSLFYIFTDSGTLVNVSLAEQGAAETLLISNNDRYWPELEVAEAKARDAGRGVWAGC